MGDVAVFRGTRLAADWALRSLSEEGILGRSAHQNAVMAPHLDDGGIYEVFVDAADVASAEEALARAEERSRMAVGVVSERLARIAVKATGATVLTVGALELLVGGWLVVESVFYVLGIWAGFFVLLARQDYGERIPHVFDHRAI